MTSDQTRICLDCGAAFDFTVNEQHFFASRALVPPKRCGPCRRLKREQRAAEAAEVLARKTFNE